ncbi:MAG: PfkB family carbohydrate kinase [Candidatus Hadarchaeales archaeon]
MGPEPEIVVVGHIAIDVNVFPWGIIENVLGGAPTYGGLALRALGKEVGVLSKVGRDLPEKFPPLYRAFGIDTEGIMVVGEHTTLFENTYDERGRRVQRCKYRAPPLSPGDLPESYREAKGFYVSPVVNEVGPELLKELKRSDGLVVLDPQGAFREVGREGRVRIRMPENFQELVKYADVVKVGREEMEGIGKKPKEMLELLKKMGVKLGIVTLGEKGCMAYCDGKFLSAEGLKVQVQDPTGAGDVFGAVFLAKYLETRDVERSLKFANAAAGLKVRYKGAVGFPSEAEIKKFLK